MSFLCWLLFHAFILDFSVGLTLTKYVLYIYRERWNYLISYLLGDIYFSCELYGYLEKVKRRTKWFIFKQESMLTVSKNLASQSRLVILKATAAASKPALIQRYLHIVIWHVVQESILTRLQCVCFLIELSSHIRK
ncbi:hypothetical protein L2E82_41184 [Cichorium intybus]|uniref:Uncharacterized protein n=1 Tax=Cichorium intybus TaxID=13427 RepID=A0ACB9AN12_CICIN|nr:hypothetical protein L2E82_41184 [Cichorium intybus]